MSKPYKLLEMRLGRDQSQSLDLKYVLLKNRILFNKLHLQLGNNGEIS